MGFSAAEYSSMESSLSVDGVSVELFEGLLDTTVTVEVVVQPRPDDLATGE